MTWHDCSDKPPAAVAMGHNGRWYAREPVTRTGWETARSLERLARSNAAYQVLQKLAWMVGRALTKYSSWRVSVVANWSFVNDSSINYRILLKIHSSPKICDWWEKRSASEFSATDRYKRCWVMLWWAQLWKSSCTSQNSYKIFLNYRDWYLLSRIVSRWRLQGYPVF